MRPAARGNAVDTAELFRGKTNEPRAGIVGSVVDDGFTSHCINFPHSTNSDA